MSFYTVAEPTAYPNPKSKDKKAVIPYKDISTFWLILLLFGLVSISTWALVH